MCSGMWLHLQDLKSLKGLNWNISNQEEGTSNEKAENTVNSIKCNITLLPVPDVGSLHWLQYVKGYG